MDFFLYLCAAAGFLILSLYFFASALFCSYKYGAGKGLLLSLGLGTASPVSLLILMFCVWMSALFVDKPYSSKTATAAVAVFIVWIIGSQLPWGIVIKNGIKNQKKVQIWAGIYGLFAAASFIAAWLCFVKFGCNVT